jgi:hypothetical protein
MIGRVPRTVRTMPLRQNAAKPIITKSLMVDHLLITQ